MKIHSLGKTLLAVAVFFISSTAWSKDKLPQTTKDGLALQHHTELGAVYLKPGASLAAYDKVKILECYVAFRKNWQRDYNDQQMDLGSRVSDKDMQEMKNKLAEGFNTAFTRELDKAGYTVVDTTGADVLLIRPAIINLEVTAPDVMSPEMEVTFVSSSGSMTLYAELYDSGTSEKIAEVFDSEAVGNDPVGEVANRVTNRAAFERTFDAWAEILVKRLDEAHEKTTK